MAEQNKKLTQEQIAALFYAKNEKNIPAQSVLEEISPLLNSYFNCGVKISGDGIELNFLNGQTFILTVASV